MIVMKWERPGIGSSSTELLGSWKTRSYYISKPDYSKTQIPVWCIFFKVSQIYSNYFSKAIKINTDFHRSINMKPRGRPSADILKKKKKKVFYKASIKSGSWNEEWDSEIFCLRALGTWCSENWTWCSGKWKWCSEKSFDMGICK